MGICRYFYICVWGITVLAWSLHICINVYVVAFIRVISILCTRQGIIYHYVWCKQRQGRKQGTAVYCLMMELLCLQSLSWCWELLIFPWQTNTCIFYTNETHFNWQRKRNRHTDKAKQRVVCSLISCCYCCQTDWFAGYRVDYLYLLILLYCQKYALGAGGAKLKLWKRKREAGEGEGSVFVYVASLYCISSSRCWSNKRPLTEPIVLCIIVWSFVLTVLHV